MTLRELKELQAVKRWKRFSYLTENQPHYSVSNPVKLSIPFPEMHVAENPNMIFFKLGKSPWISGFNGMTLNREKPLTLKVAFWGTFSTFIVGMAKRT